MNKLTLFDFCSECNINFKSSTSVQIVGFGFHENIDNPQAIHSFISTAYLTVQPIFSSTEYDISCTLEELLIIAKMKLPVVARICLHNTRRLDERPTNRDCLIDEDADWAKHGIALSNMLLDHNSEPSAEQEEQKIYKKFCDLVPKSESVRQPEKIEETQDSVKLTWSIPQEFEQIKAQAKRLKAEKKKWKRDFKSLVRRLKWFNDILDIEKKQQSMIGYQNPKGAKDED